MSTRLSLARVIHHIGIKSNNILYRIADILNISHHTPVSEYILTITNPTGHILLKINSNKSRIDHSHLFRLINSKIIFPKDAWAYNLLKDGNYIYRNSLYVRPGHKFPIPQVSTFYYTPPCMRDNNNIIIIRYRLYEYIDLKSIDTLTIIFVNSIPEYKYNNKTIIIPSWTHYPYIKIYNEEFNLRIVGELYGQNIMQIWRNNLDNLISPEQHIYTTYFHKSPEIVNSKYINNIVEKIKKQIIHEYCLENEDDQACDFQVVPYSTLFKHRKHYFDRENDIQLSNIQYPLDYIIKK
jgi:hypothetical protein